MKKILKALLLLMLVLTAAEAAFLVARHTAKPPETGPDKTGTPAEGKKQAGRFLPAGYKITYQAPDDEAGRTVIFDSRTPYSHHNGAGSVPLPDSPDSLSYAVGLLEDWRKIADSDDYELALRDPLAGADLPLFRVPVASTSADRQALLVNPRIWRDWTGASAPRRLSFLSFPKTAFQASGNWSRKETLWW